MNVSYTARVEIDRRADTFKPDDIDALMAGLSEYAPACRTSPRGWLELSLTVPGTNLRQATMTALAVLEVVTRPLAPRVSPIVCQMMRDENAGADEGPVTLPSLIGTSEAAGLLRVSPQRVTQLVNAGQLSATRAGRTLVLARHEVEAFAARTQPSGRPRPRQRS